LAVFVLKPQQEKQAKEKDKSSLLFPLSERQKIVEIKIENPNGLFDLKRKAENNEEWRVVHDGKNYEADKASVDGIISTLLAAKKENSIDNKDLPSLGLQPPKFRVIINDGETRDLSLGDDTPVDYLVFAKWNSGPEVFTTTRSLRFGLEKKISDLRNKKVINTLKLAEINRFEIKTLAQEGKPSERLVFEKSEDGHWSSGTSFKAKLETTELENFLNLFNNTVVTGFASDDPKDREKLGFSKTAASFILYPTPSQKGAKVEPKIWALSRMLSPDQNQDPKAPRLYKWYFARLDQDSTYEVAETFADHFKTELMKFRVKDLVGVEKKSVTGLNLSDGKSDLEFKKDAETWKVRLSSQGVEGPWFTGKKAAVEAALDAVVSIKATRFLDGQNAAFLGLKAPARVIELRGKQADADVSLGTLFIGRKLKDLNFAARSLKLDTPVAVGLQLDQILPMNLEHFAEVPATPPPAENAKTGTGAEAASGSKIEPEPKATAGGKRMKLEPTVKNLSEIKKLPASIVKGGHKYTAEMTLSDDRKLSIEFDSALAPYTVSNFIHLARNGFYDGLMFHRVIADFVIQGGDPSSRGKSSPQGIGSGGPGYKFDNEDNDLKHLRGSLSMAHAGRDTNGSQFFIVLRPQPHLDGIHTVFGKLTKGEEIIDSIKAGSFMKKVEVFEQAL
jgi:peptidyl-prolyl cis-trans isomerase B (cyclophilin B)